MRLKLFKFLGKSSITLRFVYDEFEEYYDPTRADSYRKRIKDENGKLTEIDILDTAGQEEYAAVQITSTLFYSFFKIRDNYYRSGEGFILVYSITDRASFSAMSDFRSQIIRSLNDPSPPLLLIGNKTDLDGFRTVSSDEGLSLAENWGKFCKFREVSAKNDHGINSIYTEISRLIENKKKSPNTPKIVPKDSKKKKNFKCQIQ